MPNWCSTFIKIVCKDEQEARKLESLIKEWTSTNVADNNFGNNWLGNIVANSGVGSIDDNDTNYFYCRGMFNDDIDVKENEISFSEDTAWNPALRVWQAVIDKFTPGAKLLYIASEPGENLFCTNDDDVKGHYYVECRSISLPVSIENNYIVSEQDCINFLKELLADENTDEDITISELIEDLHDTYSSVDVIPWDYESADCFE
jgi:hypothetical protein